MKELINREAPFKIFLRLKWSLKKYQLLHIMKFLLSEKIRVLGKLLKNIKTLFFSESKNLILVFLNFII